MSDEIKAQDVTGLAKYAVIQQITGAQVWDDAGDAFAALAVADWGDYAIAMTETPANSGRYVADWPDHANMVGGHYRADVYTQAGGSPAITDDRTHEWPEVRWNGSAIVQRGNTVDWAGNAINPALFASGQPIVRAEDHEGEALPKASDVAAIGAFLSSIENVDGVPLSDVLECLLAYINGQTEVEDHGDGTFTIKHMKQDGATVKLQTTYNLVGEWIDTAIDPAS